MSNKTPGNQLTHLDEQGQAKMVDVGDKDVTERVAVASAIVSMLPETLALVLDGEAKKGDVLAVARVAGIQAAKKCSELIPLCHPLALTLVEVNFEFDEANSLICVSTKCKVIAKTGVEMEALTAASIAALTIYDMCKGVDRGMVISEIVLRSKSGGKSGDWVKLA
jgi:cyclic pyranopterin phosphate synthase